MRLAELKAFKHARSLIARSVIVPSAIQPLRGYLLKIVPNEISGPSEKRLHRDNAEVYAGDDRSYQWQIDNKAGQQMMFELHEAFFARVKSLLSMCEQNMKILGGGCKGRQRSTLNEGTTCALDRISYQPCLDRSIATGKPCSKLELRRPTLQRTRLVFVIRNS